MGIGRKSLSVSEKDKLVTAYHEGGHALISLLTKGATPLHKVTILPRGAALGFVLYTLIKDRVRAQLGSVGQHVCAQLHLPDRRGHGRPRC